MARIRTIKPDFWQDEKISALPLEARLLFIGCWNIADDSGVLRGSERFIKSQLFPYDDTLRVSEVKKWLDALVKARFLIPLTFKGESYLSIRTFNDHQKIDKPSKTRYIPENMLSELLNGSYSELDEQSENNRRIIGEHSSTEKEVVSSSTEVVNSSSNGGEKISPDRPEIKKKEAEPFQKALNDFSEMRKKIKKPMTERAVELLKIELEKLAPDNEGLKIKILEQSTLKCWQGVFPLKTYDNGTPDKNRTALRPGGREPAKNISSYGRL